MVGSGSFLWSNPKLSLFYETLTYLNTTIKIFLNISSPDPKSLWVFKAGAVWDVVADIFFSSKGQ